MAGRERRATRHATTARSARPTWSSRASAWQRRLFDAGYAGIHWPVEYGGQGLTPEHNGAWMRGVRAGRRAAVLQHGRPRARRRRDPAVRHARAEGSSTCDRRCTGDQVWCQLFSEPGAGSDLGGLSTRAERDGDRFVVNGQKVWCSRRPLQRLGHPHGPHRSRTRRSTRASRSSCSTWTCPASRSGRCGR